MHTQRLLARRLTWLVVAALATMALFAPVAISNAASVTPTHPTGNPTCADFGYSLSFKIDTGDLENTTYAEGDTFVVTNWDGQEITISGLSADGQTFDWSSTLPVSAVLVKAGNDNNNLYTYNPPVTSDTDLTHGEGQQGISHLLFCGNAPTSTPSSAPPSSAPTQLGSTQLGSTQLGSTQLGSAVIGTAQPAPPSSAPPSSAPPSAGQFSVPAFSIVCGGSITVTNFAFANVDDVLITPGGLVITADGTFPLAPGDYIAVGRVAGEVVTDEVPFTIEECPERGAGVAEPLPLRWRPRRHGRAGLNPSADQHDRGWVDDLRPRPGGSFCW